MYVKCKECDHFCEEKMKCYPESRDCRKEYDLTELDIEEYSRCDFFDEKKEV